MDYAWHKAQDIVDLARQQAGWRTSVRDAATGNDGDGEVVRLVRDVIIPGQGPTFSADSSRGVGRVSHVTEDTATLACSAVAWLPGLADQLAEARELLRQARDVVDLDAEVRSQMDALLATPSPLEAYDQLRDKATSWPTTSTGEDPWA